MSRTSKSKSRGKYPGPLPKSLASIIIMLIADYPRRENAIKKGELRAEVIAQFQRINGIVDKAFSQIEEGISPVIFDDVLLHRGYLKSPAADTLSCGAYYRRKRKVMHTIAASLNLI